MFISKKKWEQGVEDNGLEVGFLPGDLSSRPTCAQDVLRGDLPLLAVVIAQLNGVGAILVDDDNDIQAAAARPGPGGESAKQQEAGPPVPVGAHHLTLAHDGWAVKAKLKPPAYSHPQARLD